MEICRFSTEVSPSPKLDCPLRVVVIICRQLPVPFGGAYSWLKRRRMGKRVRIGIGIGMEIGIGKRPFLFNLVPIGNEQHLQLSPSHLFTLTLALI